MTSSIESSIYQECSKLVKDLKHPLVVLELIDYDDTFVMVTFKNGRGFVCRKNAKRPTDDFVCKIQISEIGIWFGDMGHGDDSRYRPSGPTPIKKHFKEAYCKYMLNYISKKRKPKHEHLSLTLAHHIVEELGSEKNYAKFSTMQEYDAPSIPEELMGIMKKDVFNDNLIMVARKSANAY